MVKVEKYCGSIGIVEDEFLDHFKRRQRIRLMGAFAMAVHEGGFSGPSYDTLTESIVRGAISFVLQTFRENERQNSTKDKDGDLGRVLSLGNTGPSRTVTQIQHIKKPSQSESWPKSSKRKKQRLNGLQIN